MVDLLSFVICTEKGRLEHKSILLAKSIRAHAGCLKDAPIISIMPRKGFEVTTKTKEIFKSLNVIHVEIDLNKEYRNYHLANKIYAAAFAERELCSEFLVFLDSDQVVLNEPNDLILSSECEVALRPVFFKGIGSSDGKKCQSKAYWDQLYSILGVNRKTYVTTFVDGQTILSYYNTGLLAVRKSAGVFHAWEKSFKKVMNIGLMPPNNDLFFLEQSVFAATISAKNVAVVILPPTYNYPIYYHDKINPKVRIHNLEEVVTIHYLKMFDPPFFRHPLHKIKFIDRETRKYQWLLEKAESCGLTQTSLRLNMAAYIQNPILLIYSLTLILKSVTNSHSIRKTKMYGLKR